MLVTTEAAGEGRNLQFCQVLVNFDLPWNPMQIEQRLGRIHRIGQDHEVLLYNLVGRGTVEQRILTVLEAKINLFELVVGELEVDAIWSVTAELSRELGIEVNPVIRTPDEWAAERTGFARAVREGPRINVTPASREVSKERHG